jgi:hypothetical protein
MNDHLSWDTLNGLADGVLAAAERERAERHARDCAECAEALAAIRATIADATRLPREAEPPDELWSDIQATIDARKVTALRGAGAGPSRGWWVTPRRMVAAAVLLVVASSAATVAVLQYRAGARAVAVIAPSAGPGAMLPVAWQAAERGYLASVEELRGQLEEQRGRLSPGTIAAVERTLATIDVAIAEAREALLRDPANAALSELLASNYRQKVELLRRAAQLDAAS